MTDTPRQLALFQLGHGPATPAQVAGLLVAHGTPPLDCLRVARESLASLVISKHAEVVRCGTADVYRLASTVPLEANDEPQTRKMK